MPETYNIQTISVQPLKVRRTTTEYSTELKYNEIPEWDSIGHMSLISALEEEFKITIETDDIVDLSSFKKGIEILKKYKIEV